MRDNLIELIEQKQVYGVDQEQERPHEIALLDNDVLADHLLANGVIVPKVKIGDKLYGLSASETRLYEFTITHLEIHKEGIKIWGKLPYALTRWICWEADLGNNQWVYLTREEAEKALAERYGESK